MQTYNPENFTIQCAKEQTYEKFYETEIALRKQLKYPPFCDIMVVNFNSEDETEIQSISNWMQETLKKTLNQEQFRVFRATPAPIDKIQNRYRYRIIIKGKMTKEANQILNKVLKEVYSKNLKTTRVTIDVNPNSMM